MPEDFVTLFEGASPPAMSVDVEAVLRGGRARRRRHRLVVASGGALGVLLLVVTASLAIPWLSSARTESANNPQRGDSDVSATFSVDTVRGVAQTYRVVRLSGSDTSPGDQLILQRKEPAGRWLDVAIDPGPMGSPTQAPDIASTTFFGTVQKDVRAVNLTLADGSTFERAVIELPDIGERVFVFDGLTQKQVQQTMTLSYSLT